MEPYNIMAALNSFLMLCTIGLIGLVWAKMNRDQDGVFDFDGPIYEDVTGLNDHTTRAHDINNVGGFSAGCTVTQDDKEHMIKMAICMRSAELYGNYALFQE